jgi:hypothetical protein
VYARPPHLHGAREHFSVFHFQVLFCHFLWFGKPEDTTGTVLLVTWLIIYEKKSNFVPQEPSQCHLDKVSAQKQ